MNCRTMHLGGPWLIEPRWFSAAVDAVNAGHWAVRSPEALAAASDDDVVEMAGRTAVISIDGPMMKGDSKFGGTSTLRVRRAVRAAAADPGVSGILLHIDSPGGTVAGTEQLGADVRAARESKRVVAHVSDLGASAAYWIASQADRITAEPTSELGSIGVYAVATDLSSAAEADGVRVHVVSTGPYKGAFVPGAPVPDEHLEDLRRTVAEQFGHFEKAVRSGREMTAAQFRAVATGQTWIASDAKALGLIDGIGSLDQALADLEKKSSASRRRSAEVKRIEMAGD